MVSGTQYPRVDARPGAPRGPTPTSSTASRTACRSTAESGARFARTIASGSRSLRTPGRRRRSSPRRALGRTGAGRLDGRPQLPGQGPQPGRRGARGWPAAPGRRRGRGRGPPRTVGQRGRATGSRADGSTGRPRSSAAATSSSTSPQARSATRSAASAACSRLARAAARSSPPSTSSSRADPLRTRRAAPGTPRRSGRGRGRARTASAASSASAATSGGPTPVPAGCRARPARPRVERGERAALGQVPAQRPGGDRQHRLQRTAGEDEQPDVQRVPRALRLVADDQRAGRRRDAELRRARAGGEHQPGAGTPARAAAPPTRDCCPSSSTASTLVTPRRHRDGAHPQHPQPVGPGAVGERGLQRTDRRRQPERRAAVQRPDHQRDRDADARCARRRPGRTGCGRHARRRRSSPDRRRERGRQPRPWLLDAHGCERIGRLSRWRRAARRRRRSRARGCRGR